VFYIRALRAPSIVSDDLAEINATLGDVSKNRGSWKSAQLFSSDDLLIYPFELDAAVGQDINSLNLVHEIKLKSTQVGRLVLTVDAGKIMSNEIK